MGTTSAPRILIRAADKCSFASFSPSKAPIWIDQPPCARPLWRLCFDLAAALCSDLAAALCSDLADGLCFDLAGELCFDLVPEKRVEG